MEALIFGGEEVVSLSRAKFYVFSDSVLCFGKMSENSLSNIVWEDKLTWFISSSQYRTLDTIDGEPLIGMVRHVTGRQKFDRIDGEPLEFEWNISQDSPHCSSATKSKSLCQT